MGTIYRRGGTYWLKYYRSGRPYRESAHTDKITEAKRLLSLREGQVVEGRFPGLRAERIKIDELACDYVRDYEINSRTSIKDAKRYKKLFTDLFGSMRVVDFRSDHIDAFIDQRLKERAANATINRELGALRRMFRLGAKQRPPKVIQLPVIPRLKKEEVRTGFFEHDEFFSLRGALPDHQKVPLAIGYWTGMRRGEILSLRWEQLDLKRGFLRIDPGTTKNGDGRVVPLMGDLPRVLARWRDKTLASWPSCPWVCHYKGERLTRLTRAWEAACDRIGLKSRLFHDLRRTAVRNMVRAGIPERVAMQISGHKTRSVFDRYDIVSERDLYDAANRLNAHFRALPFLPARATVGRKNGNGNAIGWAQNGHNLGTVKEIEFASH
jgi:integrase